MRWTMLVHPDRGREETRKRIGFEVLIETALGMAMRGHRASSRRLEAMSFGVADYAASTRARHHGDRRCQRRLWRAHRPRTPPATGLIIGPISGMRRRPRMLVACRAYGLRPIDGPFGDFGDPDGFIAAAKRAAVLGYEGKWAIHPSQIELAHQVFTPSEAEVTKATPHRQRDGRCRQGWKGAVSLDGRLIDIASIRMAEALLKKAAAMGAAA